MISEEAAKALRAPFESASVGKLPRVTCQQCSKSPSKVCDKHSKTKCNVCDNYITSAHIHLDYVGHAAVTDRLLSVDPEWTWEPIAFDEDGAPLVQIANEARMWIRLTVCGVTRLGVGIANAQSFELEKQLISDALRNAAMRFGVGLDLWSKQDLHDEEPDRPVHASKLDVDELSARIEAAPPVVRDAFVAWKNDQGFPWPWPSAAVVAMHRKLDEIAGAEDPVVTGNDSASAPPFVEEGTSTVVTTADGPGEAPARQPDQRPLLHGYDLWPARVLRAQCERFGLPVSGTKDRLVGELRAYNALNRPGFLEYDDPDEEPF